MQSNCGVHRLTQVQLIIIIWPLNAKVSCQTGLWWILCCFHQSLYAVHCFSIRRCTRWDVAVGKFLPCSRQCWARAAPLHNMFAAFPGKDICIPEVSIFLASAQMLIHPTCFHCSRVAVNSKETTGAVLSVMVSVMVILTSSDTGELFF